MAAATSWHTALSFSFPPNPWRLLSAPPLLLPCTTPTASLPHTTQLSTQTCSLAPQTPTPSATLPHTTQYPAHSAHTTLPWCHPFPHENSSVPSPVLSAPTQLPPSPTQHSSEPRPVLSAPSVLPPHPAQNNTAQYPALFSQPHPYCHSAPQNTAQYPDLFSQPHPCCHPVPHNTAQYRWRQRYFESQNIGTPSRFGIW